MWAKSNLNKWPGNEESKSTILSIESIVVRVKDKVIEIEKPEIKKKPYN